MKRLQVLHNKVMKFETRMKHGTPTNTLLSLTNRLSVQQLVAHYSMTQGYRVVNTRQPHHHFQRFVTKNRTGPGTTSLQKKWIEFKLSVGRGSFFYQASRLWAGLPSNIQS